MKIHVALNSFYLNGYTLGFHSTDLKFKTTLYKQFYMKAVLNSFYLNGHTLGFHRQTSKLQPPCTT